MNEPASNPNPNPTPTTVALEDASIAALVTELMGRGQHIQAQARALADVNAEIMARVTSFNTASAAALTACEDVAKTTKAVCGQITQESKKELSDLVGMSKHQLKNAADASRQECEAIAAGLVKRVEELEEKCLKRVEAAETECRSTVETVTAECNRRAEAAEEESLRCIEQAERAVRTADALGTSFNLLNERLHGIELMFRTLMGGGNAATPVYQLAQPSPQPLPAPPVPPVPPAPPAPSAAHHKENGQPRRRYDTPPMQFVLIGLHHKDEAHISAKLPAHIRRAATITVVENTMKELLPKSADYCLVGGDHDMAIRWKFCMDHYGSAKCVRLENNSVATFRAKIEQLYTARHPLRAPENLLAVSNVLEQVDASRF